MQIIVQNFKIFVRKKFKKLKIQSPPRKKNPDARPTAYYILHK